MNDRPATRPIADVPSALSPGAEAEIADRLGDLPPAVFLDFDGTLTPIVEDPDAPVLDEHGRRVLRELASRTSVVVVSGRDRADVVPRVGLDGVIYAGSHGFDITGPDGLRFELDAAADLLPELDAAERDLRGATRDIPGAQVERKRYAVALHYRRVADDDVDRLLDLFDDVAGRYSGLRTSSGKKVVELRPDVDWHKGRALRWLLDTVVPSPHGAPLYIGDDVTDEDAFREIWNDGVGIVVEGGDHMTAARWSLADVAEVIAFLADLAAHHGGSGSTS